MKKLTLAVISTIFLAASIHAEVSVSFTQGAVAVYRSSKWVEASKGMKLASNEKIKTLPDSKAVLLVDNSSKIWVRKNTEMVIKDDHKGSWFDLLAGKLRAKVKLAKGKSFQIKTPIAVASVRGTELIITSEGELTVLEGRVEFSDVNMGQMVEVSQGQLSTANQMGELSAPRDLLESEKTGIEQEWTSFEMDQSNSAPELMKTEVNSEKSDDLRGELAVMVNETKIELAEARKNADDLRDSDFSSGRTMRDVHGNVVRVEQHLLRPDDSTIQLLNLTKRDSYVYSDRNNWGFTVANTPWLDVMDVSIKMNMPLPDQITAWPGYIQDKGDAMRPENVSMKFSNNFNDEMVSVGNWSEAEDKLVFEQSINGWDVVKDYDPIGTDFADGSDGDGSDTNQLYAWGISPQIKITKNDEVKYIRLFTEAYGINNAGNILSLNDFTSSSENPFTVLKQVGMEHIVFARELNNTSFFNSNLDLVVTPDLIITLAEKLAGQIGELNKDQSSQSK